MYDADTVRLITDAPSFGDLDLDNLPKLFTDDYTKLVSFRLSINEQAISQAGYDELIEIQEDAQRIALTYEAYLAGSLNENKRVRKAAAFVSASAHQVWSMVDKLLVSRTIFNSYINPNYIHPELSCAILFFVSGYTADAAEVAKSLDISDEQTTEVFLLKNIKNLLCGRVNSPIATNINLTNEAWIESDVIEILWKIINKGLVILINILAGISESEDSNLITAASLFDNAKSLSSYTENIEIENFNQPLFSSFTGPRHLAVLMSALAEEIAEIALVKIPVPNQINAASWNLQLRDFAKKRPYLWPNHLQAIKSGYLEIGTSAVMSFPTGGGKSTLAELKIAVALLNHKSIIFIAPTLALVDQVTKNLKEAFPTVRTMFDMSDFEMESIEIEELPDIYVMTPESCLVRMSFNPELFSNVGLFIFDECHLLHPKGEDLKDRRSIDSMLCLIYIMEISPDTDILLMSAMMKNTEEIASWIQEISDKPTLPLTISWKPTRQAKGCVVYEAEKIQELRNFIRTAPKTNSGKLTAASKRELNVMPFSFFSLNQTWHSNEIQDYRMVKLLGSLVRLGTNDQNLITANKNHVASEIAKQADLNGIKTLIFIDTKKNCDSLIDNDTPRQTPLAFTSFERTLLDLIIEEFGGESFTYTNTSATFLPHHGLLTKLERALHETLFKRKDGIDVIVATSTLAQGINLPAELVIIAGNTRFDSNAGQQEEIDAHDILNAAGRAGRAGEAAKGLVLVIPSQIVSFNSQNNRISNFFMTTIKEVFSETDQCLNIQDPIKLILDRIHINPEIEERNISYFIERVPNIVNGQLSPFIEKTFGYFQAKYRNDEDWILSRVDSANEAFRRIRNVEEDYEYSWHDKLAAASGIPTQMIKDLALSIREDIDELIDFNSAFTKLFMWLSESIQRIDTILRANSINEVFGGAYTNLEDAEKLQFFLTNVYELCKLWMLPQTLSAIEAAITGETSNLGKCDKARRFTLRLIPEIAYSAGIFSQIYKNVLIEMENLERSVLEIEMMGQLVKNGFMNVQVLALNQILKNHGEVTRMKTSRIFKILDPLYLFEPDNPNDFGSIREAMKRSYELYNGL